MYMYIYTFCVLIIIGRPETRADKLRSIVAQMIYAHAIDCWDKNGVPFRTHMYIPEVHPLTLAPFHEREDEGHVFKVHAHLHV